MNVIATFKRIDISSFWSLFKISIQNPLFLYPTYKATRKCLKVSTNQFGRAHYQNSSANAFRHAFWNYLIAKYCTKWSKITSRILKWTKSITDWHENAFKNRELARLMDFHNNEIGRAIFIQNQEKTEEEVLQELLQLTNSSKKIEVKADILKNKFNLVHITE